MLLSPNSKSRLSQSKNYIMQSSENINNTMIWSPRRPKPVKTWGKFNLAILKVNLNPLWKNQNFTIGLRPLTSYYYLPVETYWHDHVQAPRPRTPSFMDSLASTSTPACVSLSSLVQQLNDHQVLERISFLIILSLCKGKLLIDLTRDLHKPQYEQLLKRG